MIAYKWFERNRGKLYPWYPMTKNIFMAYNPKYIITRAEGCGPFACFGSVLDAQNWISGGYWDVLYKVKIKPSKDIALWVDKLDMKKSLPSGTILADEFEILKRIQ